MGERARVGLRRHVRLLCLSPRDSLQLARFVDETSFGRELGKVHIETGKGTGRVAVSGADGATRSIE